MIPQVSAQRLRAMYSKALGARRFEEAVVRVGPETAGWYHTGIGQECTAVVLADLLASTDYTSTSHRNHHQALARGVGANEMMAEIFGRATGVNKGFGGSMHTISPEHGIVANSAMVGGVVSPMVGTALATKLRGEDRVSVTSFGDGAVTEGAIYEALCLAALWQVPIVFVCENDRLIEMDAKRATGTVPAREVKDIPFGFDIEVRAVDGSDVGILHNVLGEVLADARKGRPWFVEIRTEPWPGKSTDPIELPGGATDIDLICGRRAAGPENTMWQVARDPLALFTRELLAEGHLTIEEIEEIDREALATAEQAVEFARSSPPPDPETAFGDWLSPTATN